MRNMDANENDGETPADVWALVRLLEAGTRLAYCEQCEHVSDNLRACSECGADGSLSELRADEFRRDLLEDEQKESRLRALTGTERDLRRATTACFVGPKSHGN